VLLSVVEGVRVVVWFWLLLLLLLLLLFLLLLACLLAGDLTLPAS
jgi:hypothetical protein